MVFDVNYHRTSTGLEFLEVTSSQLRASGLSSFELGPTSRHKGRIVYLSHADGDTTAFMEGVGRYNIELKISGPTYNSDWILDLYRADGKGKV